MKLTKKLIAVIIAALMALALLPVGSLARTASASAAEAKKLSMLDDAWAPIERVEEEAIARRASASEVTMAAYKAAMNNPLVDRGSLKLVSAEKFSFTVDGMHCMYYYNARNTVPGSGEKAAAAVQAVKASSCGSAGSMDVLLVGPYYSDDGTSSNYYDSRFSDQYLNEANSIAEATGGTLTILGGHSATGPAIAEAYMGKGIVIYDSHGTQDGTSSYLCLTTNTGITSEDYSNGWAVSSGSAAFIDGRYIQHHVSGTLSNPIVWMAICEGMKVDGYGTTGTALLAAGAGCVYGYSQSVTFSGDYKYEATFWTEMKNGATVADALQVMKSTWGVPDPDGDAYPIVMSAVDPFPSNPDAAQDVACDWTIFTQEPVALESFNIANSSGETITSATMAQGKKAAVKIVAEPLNANGYTVAWSIADANIASVTPSTNGKNATITGINIGSTTLTATVTTESKAVFTKTIDVTVTEAPQWKPTNTIVPGEEYLIGFVVNGVTYLAVNYNENASNHYYNSISSNYYGYTAPATMINGNVIGVSGNAEDLDYCTWKFSTAAGGQISSGYQDGYYLQVYTGTSYADLHPGTNGDYVWTFDPAARTLSTVTSATRYAQYYANGSNHLMGVTGSVPTNGYVQLFSVNGEGIGDLTYHTVTFKDWDGTVLKTEEVVEGYPAHAPANPVRPGYRFLGWDVDFSSVTSDLIVTALYEKVELGSTAWVPTSTIVPGEDYLIGFVVDGTTYLMVNCNVNESGNNQYYANIDYTYYGYTAPAEMVGEYVIGVSGNADDLQYCTWKFNSSDSGYTIQSGYESGYYLITWSSSSYDDLHPSSTNTAYYWQWNSADKTLYRTISGTNRYAQYVNISGADLMKVGSSVPTNGYVQLFHEEEIGEPATTYTVTFVDGVTGEVITAVEVEEGEAATAPEAPEHEGYEFIGWDVDFSNVTSDLTVTAQYEEVEVPPTGLLGDVDCDGFVTMADVTLLSMYLNGENPEISEQGMINANANGDGGVDIRDIAAIYEIISAS